MKEIYNSIIKIICIVFPFHFIVKIIAFSIVLLDSVILEIRNNSCNFSIHYTVRYFYCFFYKIILLF